MVSIQHHINYYITTADLLNSIMFKFVLCLALATAALAFSEFESEVQVVIDPEGNDYYLVPIELLDKVRTKRGANSTASVGSDGLFARHDQTIFDDKTHRLDASGFAARDNQGVVTKGGTLEYSHIPSDTKFSYSKTSEGTQATATGTIFANDNHRVEGSGFVQKLKPGIDVRGGEVKYSHIPSESSFSLTAKQAPGFGSKVEAAGTYNFFKTADGRGTIGLSGTYGVTSGRGGGGRNCGAYVGGSYKFK